MPSVSRAQRIAMAIAEHHPSQLNSANKGLLKMSHQQLHEFADTSEKHLPEHVKHHEYSHASYSLAHGARHGS